MNESLLSHDREPKPAGLGLPPPAWARLRSHLGPPGLTQEVWDASLAYGVSCAELADLIGYWREGFEVPSRVRDLPCFSAEVAGQQLRFVSARSRRPKARPLLLLHGYTGSLVELGGLAPALNDAGWDVVSPALPGFGSSRASATAFARACAALMTQLGYSRYTVHGSDLGANLAFGVAAAARAHVAALHVSHVPSYPGTSAADLASLGAADKSKLARLTELHEQLQFELPQTLVEELAFAISRLDDGEIDDRRLRDDLLTSLTLSYAFGNAADRAGLYRASGLAAAPSSGVPVVVDEQPLGTPSLRGCAERDHHVVEWREHETGGSSPGIEHPDRLLQALTQFRERLG